MIKKSYQRRFKSRNRHVSVTYQELKDAFIIFLVNDINQLIEEDKNEKNEIEKSDTIIFSFKTFIFFQKFKQAKDCFSIKINTKNLVFFHFYDRKFFKTNSHQIIFVN